MPRILEEFARAPAPPVAAASERAPWILKAQNPNAQQKRMGELELA